MCAQPAISLTHYSVLGVHAEEHQRITLPRLVLHASVPAVSNMCTSCLGKLLSYPLPTLLQLFWLGVLGRLMHAVVIRTSPAGLTQ